MLQAKKASYMPQKGLEGLQDISDQTVALRLCR